MIEQSSIPAKFRAGETVTLTLSQPGYPAPTWALRWVLRKPGQAPIVLDSVQSGTNHSITSAADISADYAPGVWQWILRAISGVVVHDLARGAVEVLANFEDEAEDPRTFAQTMRDAYEALVSGRALDAHETYAMRDISVTKSTREELTAEWRRWSRKAAQEGGVDTSRAVVTYD